MSISTPFIQRPVGTTLLTIAVALAGVSGVSFPAGVAAAAGGFPDRFRWCRVCPAPARDDGVHRGHAAGAAVRPHRRRDGDDFSAARWAPPSITLQFDLNRNIDAAARDVQAAINAARSNLPANLPSQPTYRKGQSRRRADPDHRDDLRRLHHAARCTTPPIRSWRRSSRRLTESGRCSSAAARRRRCASRSIPTALNNLGLESEYVATVLASANANLPKGAAWRRSPQPNP